MPKKATIRAVNQRLAAAGHAERLVKGKGYFYFADGDAYSWPATAVYVFRVSDLTVGGWIDEHARLKAGYARRWEP